LGQRLGDRIKEYLDERNDLPGVLRLKSRMS
jgi:hypothetical protein